MKHHVLLGLILGLLATVRLGAAEPPLLFNVVVNPAANTVTINSTTQRPLDLDLIVPLVNANSGITLINFFPNLPQIPAQFFLLSNLTTAGSLILHRDIGSPETLDALQIYAADSLQGRPDTSGAIAARETNPNNTFNPKNSGKNLNLGKDGTNSDFDLFNFSFADANSVTSSLTIQFPFALPSTLGDGPLYVYAGINTTYSLTNNDDQDVSSFLGTYTITVVPEPSTYAAIAGGLGLLAAVLHRRRQRARATAA